MKVNLEKYLCHVGDMSLKRRTKSVIDALDLKRGKKILDIGCGDGYYLHLLSSLNLGLVLIGSDYDERGLESARGNLKTRKIPLVQADLMKRLPFPNNSFDGIVMSEVAEHLPNDVKGLKEIYRVLKPGGVLALTVPSHDYPLLWDPVNWILEHLFNIHIKSGFWAGIWNQHIRLYKLDEIISVVKKARFNIEKAEQQTFWCLPFNHNLINFGARLLVNGRLPSSVTESASKFSDKPSRGINIASIFFSIEKMVDKLNEILPIKSSGVTIFIKAVK